MIFSTLLSLPCEGRVLNPLPSPRPFQKGKGCNRPPVLRTAALYGWRTIKGLRQVLRAGTAWGGVAVVWEKGSFLGVKGMAGDSGGEC